MPVAVLKIVDSTRPQVAHHDSQWMVLQRWIEDRPLVAVTAGPNPVQRHLEMNPDVATPRL